MPPQNDGPDLFTTPEFEVAWDIFSRYPLEEAVIRFKNKLKRTNHFQEVDIEPIRKQVELQNVILDKTRSYAFTNKPLPLIPCYGDPLPYINYFRQYLHIPLMIANEKQCLEEWMISYRVCGAFICQRNWDQFVIRKEHLDRPIILLDPPTFHPHHTSVNTPYPELTAAIAIHLFLKSYQFMYPVQITVGELDGL